MKSEFSNFEIAVSRSLLAVARSLLNLAFSAATSTVPDKSRSIFTAPTAREADDAKELSGADNFKTLLSAASNLPIPSLERFAILPGINWVGFNPWSLLKRRTSVITAFTLSIAMVEVESIYELSAVGHFAITSDSPPVKRTHKVSVINGITGCNNRNKVSKTLPITACALLAPAPPSATADLANSKYQSQKSSQAK